MIARCLMVLALVLFGSSWAAGAPPLSRNVEESIEALRQELVDYSRPVPERLEVVAALGAWATPVARPPLLEALKDPAPEVRAAAGRALGWAGNREAVPALVALASRESEPGPVKAGAIHALGVIGDRSSRDVVLAATQSPQAEVRNAALWGVTLGGLVDPSDRTTHLLKLAEDRALDGQLRCDAIRALSEVKEDRVVDLLMRLLEHEPRLRIALPPGRITEAQIMVLRRMQALDVPAWTAGALGTLQAKRALPLLLAAADEPRDFFLRRMCLEVLIAWGVDEAVPVFLRRLEDPLAENRMLALTGLAKRGDPAVVTGPIVARLADRDASVRAQAVTVLAERGDPASRQHLEALKQTEVDASVRGALEKALARLPR